MCTTLIQKMARWWVCTAALTHRNQSAKHCVQFLLDSNVGIKLHSVCYFLWHWTIFCLLLCGIELHFVCYLAFNTFISLLFDVLFCLWVALSGKQWLQDCYSNLQVFHSMFPKSSMLINHPVSHAKNNRMQEKKSTNSQLRQLWHKYSGQKIQEGQPTRSRKNSTKQCSK